MKNKKKEAVGFIVFCGIVILLVLCSVIPGKIRKERAEEEYRYLSEETQETSEYLRELEQKSREAKEKLLKDLEALE